MSLVEGAHEMKIEKLRINVTEDQMKNPSIAYDVQVRKKINEIIDALICPTCGNVKGKSGSGLCFDCDQKEAQRK